MAHGRKLKIADNINQIAEDIIHLILKSHASLEENLKHKAELAAILKIVNAEYNAPLMTWQYLFYQFYRLRTQDISETTQRFCEGEEQLFMLDVITDFLKKGACDSTSANTILLNELIKKLDQYEALDCDERFEILASANQAALMGIRITLRDVLVRRARETIDDYTKIAEANLKIHSIEKKPAKKLNLDEHFTKKLKGIYSKVEVTTKTEALREGASVLSRPEDGFRVIEDYRPSKKINFVFFAKVKENIEARYGGKSKPVESKPILNNVGKVQDTYHASVSVLNNFLKMNQSEEPLHQASDYKLSTFNPIT